MAKKIIIEVGQTFSIYDTDNNLISKVKCVEDGNDYACKNCIFHNTDADDCIECNGCIRPDGIDVHFEYVKL